MSNDLLVEQIYNGANELSLPLTEIQARSLGQYVELLAKWNKAYNLTAVREPDQMVSRHILDSLSIVPYIKGDNILDVGSGPGLPGIPLAIMYPEKRITTLDSNGKKTRFMTQAKIEMGLKNLTVVNTRVESYQPDHLFDGITSRAFSSLSDMVEGTKHLLADSGVYLAMKGLYPEEELSELTQQFSCELVESISLNVPGSDGERHLVILRNKY
ncbi:16S rRNA (guanine(527)-N(7))-methyltransferase RsmG [Endozoicomonas sp. Mp262]|uniref:16S rRNA (guanine(527)-N(7))-methyltransferase RsmG n=1 Tax=Endozoicomonas sp. Mp262 TaxID=2919499 RepID=UPI0021D7F21E